MQTEKAQTFVRSYFERCIKMGSTNEVTVVVYCRLFYPQINNEHDLKQKLMEESSTNSIQFENCAFQKSK